MAVGDAKPLVDIGIASWIIQDGNYGDFAVGDSAKFALEFYPPRGLQLSRTNELATEHLVGARYRIRGRVAFSEPKVWVVDTGTFLAFQEQQPPEHADPGALFEGEIYLGIDPFFYSEYLHRIEGMPPLAYRWGVSEILRETTPWMTLTDGTRRQYRTRDERNESYVPVTATNAWRDDGGTAHYVLRCECVGGPEQS